MGGSPMHDVGDFGFKKLEPLKEFKVRNIEHWRFCRQWCFISLKPGTDPLKACSSMMAFHFHATFVPQASRWMRTFGSQNSLPVGSDRGA
jgi:hypothetical protein